jgi:hypothetical protein
MEQTTANECAALSLSEPTPKSTILPAFTLFIMSPLIAEVLLGATPLTHIGGLVIVAPFYGCGVLLIRELVRRRTPSWWPVVLSGFAYMLVEEGLKRGYTPDANHKRAVTSLVIRIGECEILMRERCNLREASPRSSIFPQSLHRLDGSCFACGQESGDQADSRQYEEDGDISPHV